MVGEKGRATTIRLLTRAYESELFHVVRPSPTCVVTHTEPIPPFPRSSLSFLLQSENDRDHSWEAVCRVLGVMLAIADKPRSAAGRVGLLLGGAVEALMPCLGVQKPEVIRAALEVLCGQAMMERSYILPLFLACITRV